jgi:hypothetical protein
LVRGHACGERAGIGATSNGESSQALRRHALRFLPFDLGGRRQLVVQARNEAVQCPLRAFYQNLYAAGGITDLTREPEFVRPPRHRGAQPDSLHAPDKRDGDG